MESIKEKGSELYESSRKSVEKYSDKTEHAIEELLDKYKNWRSDIKTRSEEFGSNIHDKYDKATHQAEERMERLRKRAAEFRKELEEDDVQHTEEEIKHTISGFEQEKEAIQEDLIAEAEDIRQQAETIRDEMGKKIKNEQEKVRSGSERIKESTEAIGESILTGAADMLDRLRDGAVALSDKLEKKSDELQHKAKGFLYEKDESGQSLMDKAKAKIDEFKSRFQEKIDEAQEAAKEYDKTKDTPYQSSPQDKENLEKSSLDDKDEFWRKAEAFAAGDFDRVKAVKIEKTDNVPPKSSSTAPGFSDEDGDGNELVDDATVISEEE